MEIETTQTEKRPVPGFPKYFATKDGEIYGPRNPNQPLVPTRMPNGYYRVRLGSKTQHYVHRIILLTFVGPPPKRKQLGRHLNGDPSKNYLGNLAWGSGADNAADRVLQGRAKWSVAEIREMRRLRKQDPKKWTYRALSEKFNTDRGTMWRVLTYRFFPTIE